MIIGRDQEFVVIFPNDNAWSTALTGILLCASGRKSKSEIIRNFLNAYWCDRHDRRHRCPGHTCYTSCCSRGSCVFLPCSWISRCFCHKLCCIYLFLHGICLCRICYKTCCQIHTLKNNACYQTKYNCKSNRGAQSVPWFLFSWSYSFIWCS